MFKVYRTGQALAWTVRGKSGELGPYDHVLARNVMFKTRKRTKTGYAEAIEAKVVADTRLLDGRIVLRDGVWMFEATGKPVEGTMPLVVFNRLGAWLHAGSITEKRSSN